MQSASIVRAVARLAAPAIAQQLLHTGVFLADRSMLGHHGAASLASMQISGPLVWSTYSVLGAFSVGSVALIGRLTGAGDREGAAAALRGSVALALGLGLTAALVGSQLTGPLLDLFPEAGAGPRAQARAYLAIAFPAMPLILLAYTLAMCLQAAGDTRTPFLVAAVGNVLNVAVNGALIFGLGPLPELGAQGAAIGSAAAMAWESVVLWVLLSDRRRPLSWRGQGGERAAIARMLRVASAALGERAVQHAGFLGFVAMIGALGATAMAANQALVSIESIVFLSAEGFGIAAAAITAQHLGAGRPVDASVAVQASVAMTALTLGGYGLVFLGVPEPLLRAFTDEPSIVTAAVPCLAVAAACAPFMGTAIVLSEALRGAGDTRAVLLVTFSAGFVVRLAASWLLAFGLDLGLVGVWLGSTADWLVRAALLAGRFRRGRWRRAVV